MIVLVHKNGQIGNRLSYLRAFLSVAIEYRFDVLNFTFDEYACYFKGTCSNWGFVFPGEKSVLTLPRLPGRFSRRLLVGGESLLEHYGRYFGCEVAPVSPQNEFMFLDGKLAAKAQRQKLIFYAGWPVVPVEIMKRHAGRIREYFSLVDALTLKVGDYLEAARSGCDLLIGIHIRQGDYRYWNNGKFFFTSAQYAILMDNLAQRHAGKRVRFIVCSNVEQDCRNFSAFDTVSGLGGIVEDMYILAGCDEIYGPQSSYSGWAAFYGKKPLYWVTIPETLELTVPDVIF